MKNDSWNGFIHSVVPIDNSNKYIRPLQEIRYSVDYKQLQFLRKQQYLTNLPLEQKHKLITFSRKQKKQFKSEAVLDLHDNFNDINTTLYKFCTQSIINNIKFVTIITGKGQGIVRNNTIDWLRKHTNLVCEYFEILDNANTCGAVGVRLRTYRF